MKEWELIKCCPRKGYSTKKQPSAGVWCGEWDNVVKGNIGCRLWYSMEGLEQIDAPWALSMVLTCSWSGEQLFWGLLRYQWLFLNFLLKVWSDEWREELRKQTQNDISGGHQREAMENRALSHSVPPTQVWETRKRGCSLPWQFYIFRLTSPFPPPLSCCPCFPPAKHLPCLFRSAGVPERSELPGDCCSRKLLCVHVTAWLTGIYGNRSRLPEHAHFIRPLTKRIADGQPRRKKFKPNNSTPAGKCTESKPGENTILLPNSSFFKRLERWYTLLKIK